MDLNKERFINQYGIALALLLVFIFILFKIPYLNYPFFWDEAWVYAPAIQMMAENGPSLHASVIPVEYSRGHPLLFHFLGGIWINIFGNSLISIHAFPLAISGLLLFLMYKFSADLLSPISGLYALVFLGVQSIFFTQATFVLPEVLVALLSLVGLYFYARGKWYGYMLSIACLLMTKESGFTLLAALGLWELVKLVIYGKSYFSQLVIFTLFSGVALIPLFIFFLLQYQHYGWVLYPEHTGMISMDFNHIWTIFKNSLEFVFWSQGKYIYCLFLVLSLSYSFYKKRKQPIREIVFISILFLLIYLVFTAMNFYTTRYLLAVLPPMFLVAFFAIEKAFQNQKIIFHLGCILTIVMSFYFTLFNNESIRDIHLNYLDAVKVEQEGINFLQKNYPSTRIGTFFLTQTNLTISKARYLEKNKIYKDVTWGIEQNPELLVLNNLDASSVGYKDTKLKEGRLKLIKRFEHNRAWFEIYEVLK